MVERNLRLCGVGLGVAATLALAGQGHAQQPPDLGPRPVTVASTPYTFDTAEQHGIKVSVVVRGLNHPFSLAFLTNGDALVTERSAGLRLVRNVASGKGGAATLEAQPIAGTPEKYTQRTSGLHDVALDTAAAGADLRILAAWDSVAPYSLAFSALARVFFVGAIVLAIRQVGTTPWLARSGVVVVVLSAAGTATLVSGAMFPLLALSTLGFELWVTALAVTWLRERA